MKSNVISRPIDGKGYELLQKGTEALSTVEANGIRIDVGYLRDVRKRIERKVDTYQATLQKSDVWKVWQRRYGSKANMGSAVQLGVVLFDEMKFESTMTTKSGRASTSEYALADVDHPFVKTFLRWKKLSNANNTFLEGIERETDSNGFLHPMYNLNLAISYRSSSDNPNFQNFPVRDVEIGELIRRCFIPRKGCALVENDFKGVEVGVSACYNLDPVLIKYVKDSRLDMHRDMAMELFFLKKDEVDKKIRYLGKNGFVFPEFYGDWYKSIAESIWTGVIRAKLTGPDGKPLLLHLAKHGITSLGECDPEKDAVKGTFEHHVMQVEHDFWKRRFKVFDKWKRDWFKAYVHNGHFDSLTGFRYSGIFDRKQTSNYPIQGSAFHCLLWSLIRNQYLIRKTKASRLIVGQIHDSMLSDIPTRELDDHNAMVKDIVENQLRKHWSWINVPLTIETEISAPRTTWHDKKEVLPMGDGMYQFNDKKYDRFDLFKAMRGKPL